MQVSNSYKIMADKYLHKKTFKDVITLDSFYKLLQYMFTEEEAEIVSHLSFAMKTPKAIAKMANLPEEKVRPILESLADRVLIIGFSREKSPRFGLLNFYPGLYEAQMVMSERNMREGDDGAFYRGFVRLFVEFWDDFFAYMRENPELSEKYQILGAPNGRIISVEKAIEATPGLAVGSYPTDKFSEMAERAKKSICEINVCTCRQEMHLIGHECKKVPSPTDVTCTITGIMAEGAIKQGFGRRLSKEEFLEKREKAADMGLIAMLDKVKDPLLVCTCCDCCCSVMRVIKQFNSPNFYMQSNFEAVTDSTKCIGCKTCEKACSMDAISVGENKKAVVNYTRCIGCGICIIKCNKKALTLRQRKDHKPAMDNVAEFWIKRYFELKGKQDNFLPRFAMGATRVLSKISPIHLTGPRARSLGKK